MNTPLIATFVFIAGVILILTLGDVAEKSYRSPKSSEFTTYTDTETGCQYIVSKTGMTARLGSDGFPLCGDRAEVK